MFCISLEWLNNVVFDKALAKGRYIFFIGGGVGPGVQRGGSLVNILQIGEGQTREEYRNLKLVYTSKATSQN